MILGYSMYDECLHHLRHGVGMLQVVSGLDQGEKKKEVRHRDFLLSFSFHESRKSKREGLEEHTYFSQRKPHNNNKNPKKNKQTKKT